MGKSRLAEEFGKDKGFLPFSGLARAVLFSGGDPC